MAAGVSETQVAVASTGVIGVQLPADRVVKGLAQAAGELARRRRRGLRRLDPHDGRLSQARLAGGHAALRHRPARRAGQGRGDDLARAWPRCCASCRPTPALSAETAELLLSVTSKRSFERVSVDGQLSTNDTVILMASGASGVRVEPETPDELAFGEALDALMRQLALLVVADGEGATRVGRVVVHGGHELHVEAAARAVANSPLVKTALNGGDANWGRVAQAVGMALPGTAPLPLDIAIEGVQVCAGGAAVPHDEAALGEAVSGREVEYVIGLPGEGAEAEVFFSDLGHGYVTINAEYTT